MKSMQWKTYRTRFLVKAKQLNWNLSFIDPLGRQHSGRKGDYLVESSEGVISIAPRKIFEDIYIAMRDDNVASQSSKPKWPASNRAFHSIFHFRRSVSKPSRRKNFTRTSTTCVSLILKESLAPIASLRNQFAHPPRA